MLFPEEDALMLKAWIIKRLENTSDADADVLAEYVIALLRHEGTVEEVRALCEAEIPDFLKEDTGVFVNDVFNTIQYRSYLPGGGLPRPNPAVAPPQGLPYDDLPMSLEPSAQNGSRKRSYHDRGDVQMQDASDYYSNNVRSYKQPRRGRGGRMDDANGFRRGPAAGGFPAAGVYQIPPTYGAPTPGAQQQPPFDPNSFDPNNPLEAMMRLQAMGVPLPPLPPFPQPGQQQHSGPPPPRRRRCRDYDTKGYCARGNSCMFEHGTDSIYVPPPAMPLPQSPGNEEYDPTSANMLMSQIPPPTLSNQPFPLDPNFQRPPQHNGKPRIPRKGPRRAAFSADGPVLDRTKSTIVAENIPEEHFSEEEVRAFFSQYGTIVEVSMRPYKHLAIVKYDSWNAANAAYRSPKVIFDNRFVKVFWYKDTDEGTPAAGGKNGGAAPSTGTREGSASASGPAAAAAAETPEIDMEDFLRRQEEAQRVFEEKRQKAAEIERQREELERKQKELLAKQQAERQRLYARIATLSAAGKKEEEEESSPAGGGGGEEKKPNSQSEALRAQLAALEAEAKQLGIDPDAVVEEEQPWGGFSYRGAYRGRGRGGFVPRGRGGYVPRAGGYRGRGGGAGRGGGHAAYAAYSIDNRPKKVAVAGADFTDEEKGEMLRQFLFGIGEFTDIHETPSATTIAFKDRKTAEKFFYGLPNKQIPGIEGQIELSWVTDQPGSSTTTGSSPATAANGGGAEGQKSASSSGQPEKNQARDARDARDDKDVAMQEQQPEEQEQEQVEMDYDVVGDDQWDIG